MTQDQLEQMNHIFKRLSFMFAISILMFVGSIAVFFNGFHGVERGIRSTNAAASAARDAAIAAQDAASQSNQNEGLVREVSGITKNVEQLVLSQKAEQERRAAEQAKQGPLFVAYMRCIITAGEKANGYTPEFDQELKSCDASLLDGAAAKVRELQPR